MSDPTGSNLTVHEAAQLDQSSRLAELLKLGTRMRALRTDLDVATAVNDAAGGDFLGSVTDLTTTAPPAAPTDGDAYIVASVATGVWAGHEDDHARWSDAAAAWVFTTPTDGTESFDEDTNVHQRFNGGSWTPGGGASPPASETVAGVIEIATQAEANLGIVDDRTLTPLKLATFPAVAALHRPAVVSTGPTHGTDIAVAIKAIDHLGADKAAAVPFKWWLSSSAATGAKSGTAADGGVSLSVGSLIDTDEAGLSGYGVTHTDGACTVDVSHTGGALNQYLWVEMGGVVAVSAVLAFT